MKVKLLSRARLLVTPWTAAYQAPPSMGFSRQEYWNGVPLPSPMDYTVHGILQARILVWEAFPFFRGSSQPRIKPMFPALQADSLPTEPQGKPKNTVVGGLSLIQGIFPTQESNPGLLHCRQILYQLSYQFSSVQSLTPCDPTDCSMPGLPVHHQLPEFTQTHVH